MGTAVGFMAETAAVAFVGSTAAPAGVGSAAGAVVAVGGTGVSYAVAPQATANNKSSIKGAVIIALAFLDHWCMMA